VKVIVSSTVYTDYVDDEENALKQEEAIRILSTKIQKANNLDDNWEPLEKLEILKQDKFYESINETAKQEVIDDVLSTDKFEIYDTEDNRYILSIEEAYRNFTRDEWLCDQVISLFNEEGQSKILLELQIHGICFMKKNNGIIRIF